MADGKHTLTVKENDMSNITDFADAIEAGLEKRRQELDDILEREDREALIEFNEKYAQKQDKLHT